ncbi:MAG TPA: type III polyketide synthase [Pirellulales bacterium]|nr:type III polyketide synthase [Pirellulales bacterium]
MDFTILGVGTALPPNCMKQEEASELAQQVCCSSQEQARTLNVLYRRSGVKTRYTVFPHQAILGYCQIDEHDKVEDGEGGVATLAPTSLTTEQRMRMYEEHAFPLALRAAQAALHDAQTPADAITHLVTVSCTGFAAPGVDIALIGRLGLPPTVERVHVGFMGCHGAINGLRVARGLMASDPSARVLLCAVELCSIHFQVQWDPRRFVGNAIFGDGAGALVGGGTNEKRSWQTAATASCLLADSTDAMSWAIRDHGFQMELSPRVPDLIKQRLRGWFEPWLARQGFGLADVGSWAVHPGGPRILSAVEEALGLGPQALGVSREVLSQCGNMSSPTVLFILERLRRQTAPRPCVMLGFGPGLAAEAALLV